MSKYRHRLPQTGKRLFISDGGMETTFIFHDGIELPYFASFDLLKNDAGTERLRRYYQEYAGIARANRCGLVLEAPTWRANRDWGARLGYDSVTLADANRKAIGLLLELRAEYESSSTPIVISGCIGPCGDGYTACGRMSVAEARDYHREQVATFAGTDADMVAALTMTHVEEATGIVLAARDEHIPAAISFTLETDGCLPSGESLREAIERCDADTGAYAAYYMINCAHPTHFAGVLAEGGGWLQRIRGIRANASRRSHAELDECTDLDDGDPFELGAEYAEMRSLLPALTVAGGCCGTDHRHVEAMCKKLIETALPRATVDAA